MKDFGKKFATVGIALVSVGAIAIAPTVQPLPRPAVPAVQLAAATSPTVLQPVVQQSNVLGALFSLDLGRFIIPPSAGQPIPTPPNIEPAPTQTEFEDAIITTYYAIEPWVRWGFELAEYAVGWIPYVGWLSGQIMIFYNFGERIVESLVVNSANWLWGPLPFGEGLGNIAEDSWNALVQLGIDQWNFWLPSLPPLPGTAQQVQRETQAETLASADEPVGPPTMRPHPLRDALAVLRRSLVGPDAVAPEKVDLQAEVDPQGEVDLQAEIDPQAEVDLNVDDRALVDVRRAVDDLQEKADLSQTDVTPINPVEKKTNRRGGTLKLSSLTSGITSRPLTALVGKPERFGKKPKLAAETSNPSITPSNASVGASNSPGATSNDSVGAPKPPRNRFNGLNKHRLTGSPSGSEASSLGDA